MSNNKSFSGGITQRYALALLELSSEANKTDEYVSSLSNFLKIYYSDNNLKNYIKNPTNTNQSQKEVFEKILNVMNADKIIKNFFFILINKKRIFFVSEIIDDKTISEIEKEISENINGTLKLKSEIDESLIGGVVLQIGSLMIDTSIKNKLANYKKVLLES